jgi:hypothetical protein
LGIGWLESLMSRPVIEVSRRFVPPWLLVDDWLAT